MHIAIPLVAIARTLGYRTVVVDPREAFASAERFPDVDRLVSAARTALGKIGIDASTAIAVLPDPKLDDPALEAALHRPAFHVGAQPPDTGARRQPRGSAGLDGGALSRLHAPIDCRSAGRSGKIALSIMARIVAARNKGVTSRRRGHFDVIPAAFPDRVRRVLLARATRASRHPRHRTRPGQRSCRA